MNNTLLHTIEPEWVEFTAHKITHAKVIWADYGNSLDNDSLDEEYIEKFHKKLINENAYVVKDAPCFSSLECDPEDNVTFLAERYGGGAIGSNGGGGRCGNIGQYQVKGIGPNCMVGDHDDQIHKYGGLDAPLAIIEIIYTNLFSVLLPLGAVKIHGLIYTGKKTGIYHHPDNKVWGVLMLREQCIRPAHFMRAPNFKPLPEYEPLLVNDVARVRGINRRLARHFKEHNQFILFLGKFLQNCANQFGFARATRIMHGTLSPSNIGIDGRWLDLPIASMLNGGVNYARTTHFYTEYQEPLNYAIELLYGYSKYNKILLNPTPLINYYKEQYNAYFKHYIGFVLGLNLDHVKKFSGEKWQSITNAFERVINSGKYLVTRLPNPDDRDPVCALMAALYLSISNPTLANCFFETAGVSIEESVLLSGSFKEILESSYNLQLANDETSTIKLTDFYTNSFLFAIKRSFLAEAFYYPSVETSVLDRCEEESPDNVHTLIDDYKKMSLWIFEGYSKEVTLFKSEFLKISYSMSDGDYYVDWIGKRKFSFSDTNSLLGYVKNIDAAILKINNFDFSNFIGKLSYFIENTYQ